MTRPSRLGRFVLAALVALCGLRPASVSAESAEAAVVPSPAEMPSIRVAVSQRTPAVDLAVHGRFNIVGLQTAASLREGRRLPTVSIKAVPQGILFGEQLLPLSGLRVEAVRDATIRLNGQRLRGALEILKQPDQTLLVINHVDLEDYLRGVLSKEAPHYWPMEALRALAITARTYALFQRMTKAANVEYDVTGDVLSQVYGGKTAEREPTSRAVRDTRGLVLTYQGKIFPTFYHSTCGGRTEHGSIMGPFDLEPLQGNIQCAFCAASPCYRWRRRLSYADVSWAVKQQGRGSIWPVEEVAVVERTMTGRVAKVRIRSPKHTLVVSGQDFRQLFGFDQLRSTAFSITPVADGIVLDGQGWGHGVGLCQWGAAELARRELSATEILAYYYPQATVAHLDERLIAPLSLKEVDR